MVKRLPIDSLLHQRLQYPNGSFDTLYMYKQKNYRSLSCTLLQGVYVIRAHQRKNSLYSEKNYDDENKFENNTSYTYFILKRTAESNPIG